MVKRILPVWLLADAMALVTLAINIRGAISWLISTDEQGIDVIFAHTAYATINQNHR